MPFLALIPLKDWIYTGLIVVLLAVGTGAWIHHDHVQQAKGAAALAAADARAAHEATAKDAAIAANTQQQLDEARATYHEKITLPPVHGTGLVCRSAQPSPSRAVPSAASGSAGASGPDVLPGAGGFDPSGAILTLLRDADAKVAALQSDVVILLNEMEKLHESTAPDRP